MGTVQAWRLAKGATSIEALRLDDLPDPQPGPCEVLVRVRACSINYRDQLIAQGRYMGGVADRDITPLSDGAGEVAAVGEGVTRFGVGDRVAATFFSNWVSGPSRPDIGPALGAPPLDGMLAEYVVLPEKGLVPMARSLSFEEAACLPCAGVTAWNALMEGYPAAGPGRWVAVLGTGGVSLLALQIAKAAGARVLVTSSSDEKLARARSLGADLAINYRITPDWGVEAMRLTGGMDHVVEVGGQGTLSQSMQAVGHGGEIAFIGVLSREGQANPRDMMFKAGRLRGVFVGSALMAERLNAAVDACGIRPVVDRVFDFGEAHRAFAYQSSPDLFGKVVIRV